MGRGPSRSERVEAMSGAGLDDQVVNALIVAPAVLGFSCGHVEADCHCCEWLWERQGMNHV